MFSLRKPAMLAATSFLLCLIVQTAAFGVENSSRTPTIISTTALQATPEGKPTRRSVLGNFKRAVVGAATLAAFRQGPKVALADDTVTSAGRIVELTVANLDGIEGNSGTIKIQLQPEWAPRGVRRFEVCEHGIISCD